MNRKLKNRLKSIYNAEPNRKYSFIQQLQSNPVWRELHPISSLVRISSSSLFILTTLTTIAVGTGLIAYNFRNAPDDEPTPDVTPIVTVTAVPDTTTTTTNTTAAATSSKSKPTTIMASTSASTSATTTTSTTTTTATTTTTQSATTTVTTTTTATTTATTSVYYSDFFDHDYANLAEATEEVKFYGYPDRNISEDIITAFLKSRGIDPQEAVETFGVPLSVLEHEFMNYISGIDNDYNIIIEGRTTNLEYIAYEGKPWTICEITITKIYQFNRIDKQIKKGDTVRIAMPGGYMPVREYIGLNPDDTIFSDWSDEQIDSTIIYEAGSNQNEPHINDVFTYLLDYANEDDLPDFPMDNFYIRNSICDIFQYRKDGDMLVSANSNFSSIYLTKEDIDAFSNFDYIFTDPDSNRSIAFIQSGGWHWLNYDCYSLVDGEIYGFLGSISSKTDPFEDEKTHTITWTDEGVEIEYLFRYTSDGIYKTEVYAYPK